MLRMPLRCFDPTVNSDIQSFDLSADDWQALAVANKNQRHLRMPCCSALVTLKTSKLGTQFFAHKVRDRCTAPAETEEHRCLKQMAVDAARRNGWIARTEEIGRTHSGEEWRADVLAEKGSVRVAVEIQWSRQTFEETHRRQRQYAQSKVRCLWLVRSGWRHFIPGKELPFVEIGGGSKEGFCAVVPGSKASLPMRDFLDATFAGRFKYNELPHIANVSVHAKDMTCLTCMTKNLIITRVHIDFGIYGNAGVDLIVAEFSESRDLFKVIEVRLPKEYIALIKPRKSSASRSEYLSQGCSHCDTPMGAPHETVSWKDTRILCRFFLKLDGRWHSFLKTSDLAHQWHVYQPEY